jgi:hypothetical protein
MGVKLLEQRINIKYAWNWIKMPVTFTKYYSKVMEREQHQFLHGGDIKIEDVTDDKIKLS